MRVIILVGASGAGKSTWIEKNCPQAHVVSADKFFLVDGVHKFDVTKMDKAHAYALRNFILYCATAKDLIVVDNTNTTIQEIAPYIAVANAYEADELEIVWFGTDRIKDLVRRNVHNVQEHTIRRHIDNMAKTKMFWPHYWPIPTVVYDE